MLETNNEQEKVEQDVEVKEENVELENQNVSEVEKVEEDSAVNTEAENNETETVEKDNSKISFKDAFAAAIIDLVVTAAASVVGLFLIDAILRFTAGFYIKDKVSFSVIIFVIVSLLYTSIMESSKGETIGKRSLKLKVTRAK